MDQMSENFQKQVDHQILEQGDTIQKYFPMNDSLLLPVYPVKIVSSL